MSQRPRRLVLHLYCEHGYDDDWHICVEQGCPGGTHRDIDIDYVTACDIVRAGLLERLADFPGIDGMAQRIAETAVDKALGL